MISAEKWYEYQENYKQYGFDMKPRTQKKISEVNVKSGINAKDKALLVALVLILGIICIGMILTTSYCAKLQYNTNRVVKSNMEIQGEIENLNVQIKSAVSLETLEYKGINQLGMVYPFEEQYIVIDPNSVDGRAVANNVSVKK